MVLISLTVCFAVPQAWAWACTHQYLIVETIKDQARFILSNSSTTYLWPNHGYLSALIFLSRHGYIRPPIGVNGARLVSLRRKRFLRDRESAVVCMHVHLISPNSVGRVGGIICCLNGQATQKSFWILQCPSRAEQTVFLLMFVRYINNFFYVGLSFSKSWSWNGFIFISFEN